ncbi:MAG: SpvB/TcaC N-terminal domain-containing protein [Blastocatellia bacterium]
MHSQTTTTDGRAAEPDAGSQGNGPSPFAAPSISLPRGGGAIRGMGEKLAANPVNGTGSMTVPIAVTPGRSGFSPQITLSYDSGSGNGPFGLGWNLSLPAITRKTHKGLPKYQDADESDLFLLSGGEDLVPVLIRDGVEWRPDVIDRELDGLHYRVHRYRPRIEGLFARIERWTNVETGATHWRSISKDNITTLYGQRIESRIADPEDPLRVFSWLICESRDDKGNAIVYEYTGEDSENVDLSQVHERNRTTRSRSANRYPKRIRYGNRISHLIQPDLSQTDWHFEIVFDYDEGHYEASPPGEDARQFVEAGIAETRAWPARRDPFSTFRAGFEIRTYRLCRRVLMFHHFPEELGTDDYLVRSTEFEYSETPVASFLASAAESGYVRQSNGAYLKKSLPPLEFEYSEAVIQSEVREIDAGSLENLPYGLDGARYQWADLDGEGVSGILTEQGESWFYKPGLGDARFGPKQRIALKPSIADLNGGQQLMDLAGDGQLDLVQFAPPVPGFHERTDDGGWSDFTPFISIPRIDWSSPHRQFIDLTGDGHADILISDDDIFTWYESRAEEGFGPGGRIHQAADEERGPRLVFADAAQSIFLADMSGDGLTDIARIRNGEVCYWPNLGYGRFGAKVTMDDAPRFDAPDLFDRRRIRLADIDGSGVTDILYLGSGGIRIYLNQSGNRWSEARPLDPFPRADNLSSVTAVDLLGNGTACLVWSSPLPGDALRPMRYVDLMGGRKPHLLTGTRNNMGAETRVEYAASTKFYLADKAAGRPWITRLPFPVHVVERVEAIDRISRNRFVTRYAYHHGYFDGVEREFRGFGMVERLDTEEFAALSASPEFPAATNIDEASHVPPVLTRTWFHTGVHIGRDRVSNFFAGLLDDRDAGEYYREPGWTDADARAHLLEDTVLPEGLTTEEEREACRALKGAMLRQEVYGLDGSEEQDHPYTVVEQNFTVRRVQPRTGSRHGVFFTHTREALSCHYERNPDDPRIGHAMTLEVDAFGNVLKSAAIGYGRRTPDPALSPADQDRQARRLVTYTENRFTNAVEAEPGGAYRAPAPAETRTFELTGFLPAGPAGRFAVYDFAPAAEGGAQLLFDSEIPYEQPATDGRQRRLIEHVVTVYRRDDLSGALPPGVLESLALPFESRKLAFTPGLIAEAYGGRVAEAMLSAEGRYVHSEGDENWWIPSGRVFYSPNAADAAAQELAAAREHFFLPRRFLDAFGNEAMVSYDARDLTPAETRDALANTVRSENDYRVMQPRLVADPNGNRAAAAFDALGMVVGTAVMGKVNENLGDSLDGFMPDLDEAAVIAHLQTPFANPHEVLDRASTRLIYDLHRYRRTSATGDPQPNVVCALAREIHDADLPPGERTRIQQSFSYSDGFGREIQRKAPAEPGPVVQGGPEINPRWTGSGWTIFNNKGQPVRRYEPFFSPTHQFEFAVAAGVSPILFYDPIGRVAATLHPNHTFEKVVFDPWRQETWDVNDTVLRADPKEDPDIGDFFRRIPDSEYLDTWHTRRAGGALGPQELDAARKAAVHANTPTVAWFDSLGRPFLTLANNRFARHGAIVEEQYATRVELDIEGNQREVIDALDRVVMRYDYDMLGTRIHSAGMEAGERWMLNDVAGQPIRAWDSRGHGFRSEYDELRRPARSFVTGADARDPGREILSRRMVYGESQGDALNHRGRAFQAFDGAGIVTSLAYDFKGNLLGGERQLLVNYRDAADWSASPALEPEHFTSSTSYDALNRPVMLITPDNSRVRPGYNEANMLERVEVNLRGADAATAFVNDIDYNARGQRERIEYGNGVRTTYEHDPLTFRLARLQTLRGDDRLQDLSYTHDPAGNIITIRDGARQTIYFNNQAIEARAEYAYDAIYRLIEASGREHIGQVSQPQTSWNDEFRVNLPHPHDGLAMRRYTEAYEYDGVGNFLRLIHQAQNGNWTRDYAYDEPSLIEPGQVNNRLSRTEASGAVETYTHDTHGNMTRMPHLPMMRWNFQDHLEATSRQVVNNGGTPETTWYVYDAAGQRVRKVTERQAAAGQTPTRGNQRIYLGGFEIYREYGADGATTALERETLHIMDDQQRVALIETRARGDDGSPLQLIRYQFGNHLGSAALELDGNGGIISYEEYYPCGSTAYQAGRGAVEASRKRYRYSGKERDEETGLNYHGARYYATWLGRWTAADPMGLGDGPNVYQFAGNNPLRLVDLNGHFAEDPEEKPTPRFAGYRHIPEVGETPPPPTEFINISDDEGLHIKGDQFFVFPHARTPEESWKRTVEEHGRGRQTLDELPQKIRESRNQSAGWMAAYAAVLASPVVMGLAYKAGAAVLTNALMRAPNVTLKSMEVFAEIGAGEGTVLAVGAATAKSALAAKTAPSPTQILLLFRDKAVKHAATNLPANLPTKRVPTAFGNLADDEFKRLVTEAVGKGELPASITVTPKLTYGVDAYDSATGTGWDLTTATVREVAGHDLRYLPSSAFGAGYKGKPMQDGTVLNDVVPLVYHRP